MERGSWRERERERERDVKYIEGGREGVKGTERQ